MTAQEPTSSERGATAGTGGSAPRDQRAATGPESESESESKSTDRPVTRLRGATVDVDPRRAKRALLVASLIALAAVAVILLIAGIKKNDQADTLQRHGVGVKVTVISCLGLLGGSGSNGAGYACKGTYSLDGHRYTRSIPGNTQRAPGSVIRGVIVADDPGLLSTPDLVAENPSSWKVFIAPIVLFAVLAVVLAVLFLVRDRRRESPSMPPR